MLTLLAAADSATANTATYQGSDDDGRSCELTINTDASGNLSKIEFSVVIKDTLNGIDIIAGRAGTTEYEANFNSAVNFVGATTVSHPLFGKGDVIRGTGYRMPYEPGRYTDFYEPTAKQTITVVPNIREPESFFYRADDHYVGGVWPMFTVTAACHNLSGN